MFAIVRDQLLSSSEWVCWFVFFFIRNMCVHFSLCVCDLERDGRKIHIYMSFCWNGQADLLVGIHYIIIMDAKSMNRWITFNSLFSFLLLCFEFACCSFYLDAIQLVQMDIFASYLFMCKTKSTSRKKNREKQTKTRNHH